jgi:pimeloyl-ACP methyl ester carboxylesterase
MREDGRNQLALHTMKGLASANPLQVQAALGGAARSDMPDQGVLKHLRIPTLILAWEDDAAHPVSTANNLAELLPNVRDVVVCSPDDISEWESALVTFVKDIARSETATRRPTGKKSAARKSRRNRALA